MPPGHRGLRGLHVAAGVHEPRRRRAHVLGPRHGRGRQRRRSPATRTFTVDTAAPDTTITSGPTGTITTNSASFAFTSEPGATFECRLDTAAFAACTSPQAYTNLADGEHTFSVRAKDAAGNVDATPASRTFTVAVVAPAPDTTITGGPSGPITATTQTFTFTSEPGATFECRLDTPAGAGTYAACTSPQQYTASALGDYTFFVRAKNAAGTVDATPATRTFRIEAIVTPTPTPTVTPTPTAVEEETTVSGTVPTVLGLVLDGTAAFPPFIPGVATEYQASISARITTSAATAELTVVDQGAQPGRLVNGTHALVNALEARATNATQPTAAFAPISATPLRLLLYPTYVASDPVAIGFRQRIGATEPLWAGAYEKTLTFTLSTTQP